MSLITWNPGDGHPDIVLGNNNLTLKPSGATSFKGIRATEGRTKGKWYWEIKIESSTRLDAQYLGFATKGSNLSVGTNITGRNRNELLYSSSKSYHDIYTTINKPYGTQWKINDSIGIAFDIDNKKIEFYNNGERQGSIDLSLRSEEYYPTVVHWMNSQSTVNFGATKFNLMETNLEEWNRLVGDGYQPYDYLNATWFAEVIKVNISNTNIWHTYSGNINLAFTLSNQENLKTRYAVKLNGKVILDGGEPQEVPISIDTQIPTNSFDLGKNTLEIIGEGVTVFKYDIVKEDRDTFTFLRRFDFKEDYMIDENIEVIYGEGLTLKNRGVGKVLIDIPTEGKSRIKNIEIDSKENIESIIPIMNSNEQDSFKVSASSVYAAVYSPWKAFNGLTTVEADSWISSNSTWKPQWLQVELPNKYLIVEYALIGSFSPAHSPKSWTFEGSNDGVIWSILDTQNNVNVAVQSVEELYKLNVIVPYKYYRLHITEKHGTVDYVRVGELKLYGYVYQEAELDMDLIGTIGEGKVHKKRIEPSEFFNHIKKMRID